MIYLYRDECVEVLEVFEKLVATISMNELGEKQGTTCINILYFFF